jgi:mono/diheme cytochrome c family protein
MPSSRARAVVAVLLVSCFGALACRKAAVREWRADDHDQEGTTAALPPGSADPQAEARALVEAAWSTNCALCHGAMGRGDGPQGPMVKATDLTDPGFLDRMTDEQIATAIRTGKGKMPAFPNLPADVTAGLVARIRALRR